MNTIELLDANYTVANRVLLVFVITLQFTRKDDAIAFCI